MLKWSVTRRVSQAEPRRLSTDVYINKRASDANTRSRRSAPHRRSSTPKKVDKENCFTSTPIKQPENHNQCEALRDVSNLTPKIRTNKRLRDKQNENLDTWFHSHSEKKKKKKACTNLNRSHSDPFPFSPNRSREFFYSNCFKQFETVDSHIEGLPFTDASCAFRNVTPLSNRVFAPTLPTFDAEESPCCPTLCSAADVKLPSKISLGNCDINHVALPDSFVESPKSPKDFNVSPLVKRLIDLRFSKVSYDARKPYIGKIHDNSSFINNLSLDKIVDAILDTTDKDEDLENVDPLQEHENELNETHEDNLINIAHEKYISGSSSPCDRISYDSGFSSTSTKHPHDVGADFVCKCSNNVVKGEYFKKWRRKSNCDKTIIDISETFNERCVDASPMRSLKRTFTENLADSACTLKRQKCIRRRKTLNDKQALNDDEFKEYESFNFTLSENKYKSYSPETFWESIKYDREDTCVQSDPSQSLLRRTRRCLSFETSSIAPSETFSSTPKSKGTVDLDICYRNDAIFLKVLRCRELNRSGEEGTINAYVKVLLSNRVGGDRKKNAQLQRTTVQSNSSKPVFNHSFRIPICKLDINKRVHIEIWHRDRTLRRSELLGCMSFAVKNVIKKDITGTFRLLSQTLGRTQNAPATSQNLAQSFASAICESTEPITMCDSQLTNEEIMSIDDFEGDFMKTSNPAALNQHQKDADENLFLRYLELDPTEGPDAIPAALQRKATGNKNGRTPFTTTKKLVRPPKSGFGFSVVWTHPPRIERIEKGLPADKAGILPGDYIIFVDKHNVVMMPEIDILNLIRSFGNQITLEIFRRNSSKNGSTLSIRPLANSSGLPTTSCMTQHRPSTVGSVNTASAECSKKRLHLPQVTFSAEVGNGIIV